MREVPVPTGWKNARLAQLCEPDAPIMYGILQPGPQIEGGVPYVRPTEIGDDRINLEEIKRTSPEIAAQYRRATLKTGDLLITIVGTLGKIAVVPPELDGANITQSSARIRLAPKVAHSSFVRQILRSPVAIRQYEHHRLGTGVPRLNIHHVRDLQIPLPPLPEQRRIADILDQAEALRAKRRAALAELDTLTQSLFLDLFGDPVTNPKSWPRRYLAELGTLDRGVSKHRPRNAPELLHGPYPLVQTGEVANCYGYIREYQSTYSDVGLRQSKMWPAGTLCITIAANIAKTGILTFDACFPDSIVGFRAEHSGTVEFVRSWFSFLQKSLEDAAPESAQKNINLALLRNLSLPLPPIKLQREFASRVTAVEKLKTAHHASLAELDALFASLQHRAFRGEL